MPLAARLFSIRASPSASSSDGSPLRPTAVTRAPPPRLVSLPAFLPPRLDQLVDRAIEVELGVQSRSVMVHHRS